MKKIRNVLLLLVATLALTGCVKFNANMEIKKDKSMDFSIIYAIDTSAMGGESNTSGETFTNEQKEELKKQGFTVEDYTEGKMKGIKITKHINNIDEVSTDKDAEYSLSGMLDGKEHKDEYMFKVEKGFLKNTYTAKYKFDMNDSSMDMTEDETNFDFENPDVNEKTEEDNNLLTTTGEDNDLLTTGEDESNDLDLSGLSDPSAYANMDLSFNLKLPYAAKSSNADTKTSDKELKWNLMTLGDKNIEFSFSLYNINPIIIYAVIALIIIAIVAVILMVLKKNKKNELPVTE